MQCLSLAVLAGVTHTHSSQLNLLGGIPSRTQAAQGDGAVMETGEGQCIFLIIHSLSNRALCQFIQETENSQLLAQAPGTHVTVGAGLGLS